jgi:hypothetical protein
MNTWRWRHEEVDGFMVVWMDGWLGEWIGWGIMRTFFPISLSISIPFSPSGGTTIVMTEGRHGPAADLHVMSAWHGSGSLPCRLRPGHRRQLGHFQPSQPWWGRQEHWTLVTFGDTIPGITIRITCVSGWKSRCSGFTFIFLFFIDFVFVCFHWLRTWCVWHWAQAHPVVGTPAKLWLT